LTKIMGKFVTILKLLNFSTILLIQVYNITKGSFTKILNFLT